MPSNPRRFGPWLGSPITFPGRFGLFPRINSKPTGSFHPCPGAWSNPRIFPKILFKLLFLCRFLSPFLIFSFWLRSGPESPVSSLQLICEGVHSIRRISISISTSIPVLDSEKLIAHVPIRIQRPIPFSLPLRVDPQIVDRRRLYLVPISPVFFRLQILSNLALKFSYRALSRYLFVLGVHSPFDRLGSCRRRCALD